MNKQRKFVMYGGPGMVSAFNTAMKESMANDIVNKILEEMKRTVIHGFTYADLKARGASDEAIELVKKKYEILEKTPGAQLTLVNNEAYGRTWVITGMDPISANKTESYRFDILNVGGGMPQMEAANMHHYKKVDKEMIEQLLSELK